MNKNILLATDGYKPSHFLQQPPKTEYVTAYIEARGSKDPDFDFVFNLGIQGYVQDYLQVPFTQADLEEGKEIIEAMGLPFNYEGWKYILDKHNGIVPVIIKALPEGTLAPLSIPLVQITNTDPKCAWVVSPIETSIVRAIWYPSTVATNSMVIRNKLKAYAVKSATDENVDFKLHDFGARGVSSAESAEIGGFAHLATGALGTDTLEAVRYALKFYGADLKSTAFTIPASEHSTITSWGEDGEVDAYRNMLKQFGREGSILAVVSDSYDIWNAVENIWGDELKQEVIDSGATVVVRPDSGDPLTVPILVIEKLMNKYGYTVNDKGFKVLPDCIRVIQGDGITKDSISRILANLEAAELSLDNIAFGMGGGMLQLVNRDTLQFAMKVNENIVDGVKGDVYKRPVGDKGKASKAGAQAVIRVPGVMGSQLQAIREDELDRPGFGIKYTDEMNVVYDAGYVSPKWLTTLNEIRARAN